MKNLRFSTRSVMVNWLISYISVLLVPILISGIIYTATWHVIESEVNRANESMLKQIEQAIDSNLAGIERLSVEMALSKRLAGFITATKPLKDEQYYDVVEIVDDLRKYKVANDYIDQIYVYYKNSDTVVSTRDHMNSRQLYERVRAREDMSYEQWQAAFDKRYIQEYSPVLIREDGQAVKAVMYAKSIILDTPEQPGAIILFTIKDTKLLEDIMSPNHSSIAVLDGQNRLIASTGMEKNSDFLAVNKLTSPNGFFYDHMLDKKYAVSYTTSNRAGWKYISMMPAELFDEKMKYAKNLISISIALSLLIGGIVTFLMLKRNYDPISKLIRSLSTRSSISFKEGSNEYGYLQAALNDTFTEKEKIGQRLEQHRDTIRSHFLQGLLKGSLERNVPIHESLAVHNMELATSQFAVLLFQVDHYGKLESSEFGYAEKIKHVQFIIMNVAEEVVGIKHQAFSTELDNLQACIINFKMNPEPDEVQHIAEQVKAFMLEHFHVHLTIAISRIHQELAGIPVAYQESLAALEYRMVMGSGEIIEYKDLPDAGAERESSYYYPLHVEQQLINFVKTGDYDQSKAMIDEIIEINVSGSGASISVPLAKCLMFDLISTMLKTIDEIGASNKREFMNEVNPIDRLTACTTIKEMRVQIGDVLKQVCQSIQEDRKQDHNQLSQQIVAYVKENYSSADLNITMMGDVFNLTPSYLSKQFKAQTGEALLEHINKTRIEEAKKLLVAESSSIVDIARRVGYEDINTFNRIFKKYEGITPGKYKDFV